MAAKGHTNQFEALQDREEVSVSRKPAVEHMTEIVFPCYPGVVGQLAGRDWVYIKTLCKDYRNMFDARNISITYDGALFRVHISSYAPGIEFIANEFGQRVAMANVGVMAQPAGAIIGRRGWWLRKTESEQDVKCTIYHENGLFFVKFPWNVSTADRIVAMDDIRRKLSGRARFFQKTFSESESESTISSASVADIKDFLQGNGPTPSEAHD